MRSQPFVVDRPHHPYLAAPPRCYGAHSNTGSCEIHGAGWPPKSMPTPMPMGRLLDSMGQYVLPVLFNGADILPTNLPQNAWGVWGQAVYGMLTHLARVWHKPAWGPLFGEVFGCASIRPIVDWIQLKFYRRVVLAPATSLVAITLTNCNNPSIGVGCTTLHLKPWCAHTYIWLIWLKNTRS